MYSKTGAAIAALLIVCGLSARPLIGERPGSASTPGAGLPLATVTILGAGGGAGPFDPVLASSTPTIPSVLSITVTNAPPVAAGFLIVAPVPANPIALTTEMVLYPDLGGVASWTFIPFTTSTAGHWVFPVWLPANLTLAGTETIIQVYFPSGAGIAASQVSNGLYLRLGI